MKENLFANLLKVLLVAFVLSVAGGLWYYTLGRKPKLLYSAAISEKSPVPTSHALESGEVLLVVGTKTTLYDTAAGKEKWTADFGAPLASASPIPAATAKPTAAPEPQMGTTSNKDSMLQILQARVERAARKLEERSAQLESKRGALNTPLKVANFKEEEAKYQAERNELETARAALGNSTVLAQVTSDDFGTDHRTRMEENMFASERREVFRDQSGIWLLEGRSVRLLDHANGRLTKEIPLPGNFQDLMRGADCIYVVTTGDESAKQITRIGTGGGTATSINATGSNHNSQGAWSMNSRGPTIEPQRSAFNACGAELLQIDVRLLEKKITEREALKQDSASDWEEADKKTSGGWSNDAAFIAQAMANDAQREMTGGKELIDESTYEVTLRRPFNNGIPAAAPFNVRGRPDVFSTASLDLVAAGKTLTAFDHSNRKLWDTTLAFPVMPPSYLDKPGAEKAGTAAQPCLEDEQRLYFFDSGVLTAFNRRAGTPLWRLPSVGIRKIILDTGGTFGSRPALYVLTANGSPETLRYSQQAAAPTVPHILKLDPASGKILWKADKYDDCFVSGGGIYATLEGRNPNDLVDSVFQGSKGITIRFKLYKLSARDGQPQWEWFQPRRPLRIAADKRKVSLLFRDELQIVSSLAP